MSEKEEKKIEVMAPISHFIKLSILLFALWLMLSGIIETKFLAVGIGSALVISYFVMPYLVVRNLEDGKNVFLFNGNLAKLVIYFIWLLIEVVKASVTAALVILRPRLKYRPQIVYFSMPYENPVAASILANSITLTPGTITLEATEDGIFEIHALNDAIARDVLEGVMAKKLAKIYGETCEFTPLPDRTLLVDFTAANRKVDKQFANDKMWRHSQRKGRKNGEGR